MAVADQIGDYQARCLPYLLTLRILVRDGAEAPFPGLTRAEVAAATEAILAEAEAASREARAATGGGPVTAIFLDVRLSRLAAAAADAIAAAEAGDFTQLRRYLHRFETLTSAIWMVQDATLLIPMDGRRPWIW
jgi:hypothetical protein